MARILTPVARSRGAQVVLRSGCSLTHDSGVYRSLSPFAADPSLGPDLRPAIEAWGRVLSLPEPGTALLDLGKRDVSSDGLLPLPHRVVRPGTGPRPVEDLRVEQLNDQHAYVAVPPDDPLAVGDLVGCGISHPCTTFDKWRLLPVVDDDGAVVDAVHTFF